MTTIDNKSVQKLISDLQSIGITFELDQEETDIIGFYGEVKGVRKLENVVFRKGNIVKKICNYQFFREGGLSSILDSSKSAKKGEENYVKVVRVTDEMYYSMVKQSVEMSFKSVENGKN